MVLVLVLVQVLVPLTCDDSSEAPPGRQQPRLGCS